MKVKQRISHYKSQPQNQQQVEFRVKKGICERVKQKLDRKQLSKKEVNLVGRKSTNELIKENQKAFKTPKKNLIFRIESTYAATPERKRSAVIEEEIETKAKEFRDVIKKATQRKKIFIQPVKWQQSK